MGVLVQLRSRRVRKDVRSKVRPAYQVDDGPLSESFLEDLREMAARDLPKGKVINKRSLFTLE